MTVHMNWNRIRREELQRKQSNQFFKNKIKIPKKKNQYIRRLLIELRKANPEFPSYDYIIKYVNLNEMMDINIENNFINSLKEFKIRFDEPILRKRIRHLMK